MEKLITRKEAAEILGISIATLDAARNNGLISYVQYVQNGCVYFTAAGLQEYIAKCTHRGKIIPCISLKGQKAFHSGYELRDKDVHDISILEGLSE